ncbi:MAG: hypothetical protein JRH01_02495 [Deltaproteobacteria bacterium]|nr:hypothetical protein [Deltaproteobacteria bacterium]
MSLNSEKLLSFILRIHATHLETLWPAQLLEDLSAELGGAFVALTRFLHQPFDRGELMTTRVSKDLWRIGKEIYPDRFPWFELGRAQPGKFVHISQHISPDEMRSSELYQRWMEPQGLLVEAAMGSLYPDGSDGPGFGWFVAGRRPFTEGEYAFCRELDPHLAQATRTAWRLHLIEQEREVAIFSLDGSPEGLCFLDAAGKVSWANRAALRTFAEADGLTLEDDRLYADSVPDRARLRQAIETCLRSADHPPGLVSLRRPSGSRPLGLVMARAPSAEAAPHRVETVAVVCILDMSAPLHSPEPVLRALYGLTAAEGRLAVAIAAGTSAADFAKRSGRSAETVRTHLKSIFRKLGIQRQSQLVAFVHRVARGPYRVETEGGAGPGRVEADGGAGSGRVEADGGAGSGR